MAYKKDIKPWLKENGYTWEDMDRFWVEVCEVNWKCKMISDSGKSWNDLTMWQIEQLPTLKEKTLEQLAEKERKEAAEREAELKAEEEEKYYREHFDEILVKKIESGEALTHKELSTLVYDYEVSSSYGDNERWVRPVETVVELCGRFFSIDWAEGLTECQDNEFYNQPVEVFPTKQVTISYETIYRTKKTSEASCPLSGDMLIKKLITMLGTTDILVESETDDTITLVTK